MLARPADRRALDVLSLRVGLRLADGLDPLARERVGLKWPNDLLLASGKLAGILVEARWSGESLSWVAIGVGVNMRPPDVAGAAGLPPGVQRVQVLGAVIQAVRDASRASGWLDADELERFRGRDTLAGRRIVAPAHGIASGVDASGALVVRTGQGTEQYRAGTIQLAEEP